MGGIGSGKPPGLAVAHGKRCRLNRIWRQMRQRCLNANDSSYPYYGGRGIRIHPVWSDFTIFREWALSNGYQDGLEIDRRDNDGDYCPENCRWASHVTQARNKRNNRRLTHNGITLSMAEWCDRLGLNYGAVSHRMRLGWTVEKAFLTPVRRL